MLYSGHQQHHKPQRFEKHKVLGHLKGDISTLVNAEAPQKVSQDDQLLSSVVGSISTEEVLSSPASQKVEQPDWRKLIVIPEECLK